MHDYWVKQADEPYFPDMVWSRPINKSASGKLLILGGNLHGFNIPAKSYNIAQSAGAGSIRIILPDALQKLVSKIFPEAGFAPSTTSGSFAKTAYAEFVEAISWADGVLLAGEFGKNSETAVLLEKLVGKINNPLVIAGDTIDELLSNTLLLTRENLVLCTDFNRIQKLAIRLKYPVAFTSTMTLLKFVETLHEFSMQTKLSLIAEFQENIFVAGEDRVSSTKKAAGLDEIAAKASVWFMQNPTKMFEALTTSLALL